MLVSGRSGLVVRRSAYAERVPDWATVVIALVAGFFSGGFGAVLGAMSTRGDREERFRNRLLDAADDLLADISPALTTLRDALGEARAGDAAKAKAAAELAWKGRDLVLHRSARIELLFGPDSDTKRATDNVIEDLAKAAGLLQPPEINADAAESLLMEAAGHLRELQRAALEAIRAASPPSVGRRRSLLRVPGR